MYVRAGPQLLNTVNIFLQLNAQTSVKITQTSPENLLPHDRAVSQPTWVGIGEQTPGSPHHSSSRPFQTHAMRCFPTALPSKLQYFWSSLGSKAWKFLKQVTSSPPPSANRTVLEKGEGECFSSPIGSMRDLRPGIEGCKTLPIFCSVWSLNSNSYITPFHQSSPTAESTKEEDPQAIQHPKSHQASDTSSATKN